MLNCFVYVVWRIGYVIGNFYNGQQKTRFNNDAIFSFSKVMKRKF